MADNEKTGVDAGLRAIRSAGFVTGNASLLIISLLAVLSTAGVALPGMLGMFVAALGGDMLASLMDDIRSGNDKDHDELIEKVDRILANQGISQENFIQQITEVYRRFNLQDEVLKQILQTMTAQFNTLNENDKTIIKMVKQLLEKSEQPTAPRRCPNGAAEPPKYFAGRQQEYDKILTHLLNTETVAITAVHGMGGLGKSTLAQYFCHHPKTQEHFGAVLWADVGKVADIRTTLARWGGYAQRGFKIPPDANLAQEALRVKHLLEGMTCGRFLLVLDNVWQTSHADAKILQSAAPAGTAILMTTREKKTTRGATVITLKPLPDAAALETISKQTHQTFITAAHREALVMLMKGHPLALEIASASMEFCENAGEIDDLLNDYTQGIAAGSGYDVMDDEEIPDRLAVTFAKSYSDLAPDLQRCFRLTGILLAETPIELSLLAQLWELDDKTATDVVKKLRERALLQYDTDSDHTNLYSQHALLRSYARKLLTDHDETDSAFRQYLAGVTTQAYKFVELQNQPEKWGFLDPLIPHLWHMGDALVEKHKNVPESWQQEALTFARHTYNYLFRRPEALFIDGHPDRLTWLEMGHRAAIALEDKRREGLFASELGLMYNNLGRKQQALDYYQQVLPIDRDLGDRGGEATTLNNIGLVYNDLGDKQKALDYFQQALPISQEVGDRGGQATTLNNIGLVYNDLGDKQKALDYFQQALTIDRDLGDRAGEATTLHNIGTIYWSTGEQQKALDHYQQALPISQEVGDRGGQATTLNNIGGVYDALGDKQKALEYYQQALPIRREVGDRGGQAVTCFNIGLVYHAQGNLAEAIRYVARCVLLDEQVQHPDLESDRATLERWKQQYRNQGGDPAAIPPLEV